MPEHRLAHKAEQDLLTIALFGIENFGVAQSRQYRDKLKQRFIELAEQPELYPAVDYIRAGYRRSVCGSHTIYYRITEYGVEIVRILGKQDIARALP